MRSLLSAYFFRLRKSVLFWGTLALSFGFGVFMCVTRFIEHQAYGVEASLKSVFFGYALASGVVLAAFIPLFFGAEYSDGAIRNKLAVGHTRAAVYLASLIISLGTAVVLFAAYLLACTAVGVPLIGGLDLPASRTAVTLGGSLLMAAAYCAIFTFIVMNCSKKATSAVVCLLGVFLLLVLAVVVYNKLEAPEFIDSYSMMVDGEFVPNTEPNPAYLTGMKRELYQFFYELLPTGQAISYSNAEAENPARMMALAAAVFAAFTAAGLALFQRKDLK